MNEIDEDIISVVVAPCTAKKWEILEGDTDYVITTRELSHMIKEQNLDLASLKHVDMDILMGHGSKSGLLFGRSGGVMEAALSQVHRFVTGKPCEEGRYRLDISGPISEASFKMGEKIINVAVVYGLANLEKLLPNVDKYDFREVMNCPGGCVGGGGQPLVAKQEADARRAKRSESLGEQINTDMYPYDNECVKELYKSYLLNPGSDLASKLLHTTHVPFEEK